MPIGDAKDEHFSCFHSSCQLGLIQKFLQLLSKHCLQTFLTLISFCPFSTSAVWVDFQYSSNQITKKEPKSEARVSKFDWHDLSPIFLAIMLLHNLKVFQKRIKHYLQALHRYNRSDQILTFDHRLFGYQLSNCYCSLHYNKVHILSERYKI